MGMQLRNSIARQNNAVQSNPVRGAQEDQVDPTIVEDEAEPGTNEQQIVNVLNASGLGAVTNRAPKDAKGKRQSSRLSGVKTQPVINDVRAPAEIANSVGDEGVDAAPTSSVAQDLLSLRSVASVKRPKRKRQEAGNTYETQLPSAICSPDEGNNEADGETEVLTHKLAKQSSKRRKAKQPLLYSKKSNSHTARITTRLQCRSHKGAVSTDPESEQSPNDAGQINLAIQASAGAEEIVERHSVAESLAGVGYEITEIFSNPSRIQVIITPGDLVQHGVLEEMLTSVGLVGQRHEVKTGRWMLVKEAGVASSVPGKRMMTRLQRLIDAYGDMRDSRAAGNDDTMMLAQIKATKLIEILKEEAKVLSKILGNPGRTPPYSGKNPPKATLTDIYFILLPKFVEVLKIGVEAYGPQRSWGTETIEGVVDLLDLILGVAEPAACWLSLRGGSVPKRLQIGIEGLRRERRRAEEVQKQDIDRRRRNKEIHRLQKQAMEAKLNDPASGDLFKIHIEIEEAKRIAREADAMSTKRKAENTKTGNFRMAELSTVQHFGDVDVELDPFNDDMYERVSIFGKNNKNEGPSPRLWSEKDKSIFIDAMRYEQGKDRYLKAAEKLERSMDEIFAKAKDLQQAMDDAHAQGNMNLPCDKWTYNIWVEQE